MACCPWSTPVEDLEKWSPGSGDGSCRRCAGAGIWEGWGKAFPGCWGLEDVPQVRTPLPPPANLLWQCRAQGEGREREGRQRGGNVFLLQLETITLGAEAVLGREALPGDWRRSPCRKCSSGGQESAGGRTDEKSRRGPAASWGSALPVLPHCAPEWGQEGSERWGHVLEATQPAQCLNSTLRHGVLCSSPRNSHT